MKAIKEYGTRTIMHSVAVCAFFIGSALTGYAAQHGDFTYVEYDTYIEITDYPTSNVGEAIIPSEIVGKPVTSIGEQAFMGCSSLTGVTIPDSVVSIGKEAFAGCDGLTSVTIPDSVTSIGDAAFVALESSLTAVTVDAANPAYSSLDGVLFDKYQTTLIRWPGGRAGAYTIPDSVTSIGFTAFHSCKSLTSVTIPDSVSSIGAAVFAFCSSLASVAIPDGVTSIERLTFIGCSSLTSVSIPDSVTSIGNSAFEDCSSLTSVTIPDSVTSIGNSAFEDCSSLTSVYFKWNAPSHGDTPFEGANQVRVYYLAGTTGWEPTYGDRPTFEARLGGIPVDDLESWFISEWFGYYATTLSPWIFHADHGWLYQNPGSSNQSSYFYDGAMPAWWWTNEDTYPILYRFSDGVWLWYLEGSSEPRRCFNFDTESWGLM